jgi:hypothetical protein
MKQNITTKQNNMLKQQAHKTTSGSYSKVDKQHETTNNEIKQTKHKNNSMETTNNKMTKEKCGPSICLLLFTFGNVGTANDIFIHTIVMQCHP